MRKWCVAEALLFTMALLPLSAKTSAQDPVRPETPCQADHRSCGPGVGYTMTLFGGERGLRASPEIGFTWPIGAKTAARVAYFGDLDSDAIVLGPVLRVRRLLSRSRTVELALGTNSESSTFKVKDGSIRATLQYNSISNIGAALRVERTTLRSVSCGPSGLEQCPNQAATRVWIGMALAGGPADKATLWSGIALLVVALLALGFGD